MTVNSNTRTNYVANDVFVMRSALIRGTDAAFGENATMLQGFANMMAQVGATIGLDEAPAAGSEQFVDSVGGDAACATGSVNWNNGLETQFNTADDAGRGPNIDSWELYITQNTGAVLSWPMVVTDGCVRSGRHKALGSWNNLYWGRYNATSGLTDSTLIMVFPASPVASQGTADPRDANSVTIHAYDDDEGFVSTQVTPDEVHLIVAGNPPGFNISGTSGELQIETPTPMYGWVVTETAGFVDMYPLYRERVALMHTNMVDADTGALIPDSGNAQSDVLLLP
jgi:hypothetical protein